MGVVLTFVLAAVLASSSATKPDLRKVVEDQQIEIIDLKVRVAQLEKELAAIQIAMKGQAKDGAAASPAAVGKIADAITQGRVTAGMTIAQADQALKGRGRIIGENDGAQEYLWWVDAYRPTSNSRLKNATESYVDHTIIAQVRDGKIVSYESFKGQVER